MRGKHRHWLICAAVVAVALIVVVGSGGTPASVGLLAVALVCPVAMGLVMWLLLRPTPPPAETQAAEEVPRR